MIKTLLITNIPAPYTVDFLNLLGKKVEQTVLFEGETSKERNAHWYSEKVCNFTCFYLDKQAKNAVKNFLNENYDIIIVGNYSSPVGRKSIRYMKKKKLPFYIHVDGGIINNDSWLKFKIKKYFLSAAAGFFSSGEQTNKYIEHYCNNPKILTYPFTSVRKSAFCDTTLLHEQKAKLRNGDIYKEEFVALFVGQFIHRKGLDILIEAAKLIRHDIGVYCLGGRPSEELIAQVNEANLKNVHFLDFIPPEKVLTEMRLADVLVFPTRYDIWGLVVNEALSQGTPVISTDKSVAALELIKNNYNGKIIKSENAKELAEALNCVFSNVNALNEMSSRCVESVSDYSIENMAEIYYNNILKFIESRKISIK